MKKIFAYITIQVAVSAMFSCGQEQEYFKGLTAPPDPSAVQVKFIHAASDTVGVNLFVDNVKITGNPASVITTVGAPNQGQINVGTVVYQSVFPVTDYSSIATSGVFSVVVPDAYTNTITYPNKTLATLSAPSLTGAYTVAFVGLSKSYELVALPDNLSAAPIDGNAYIRFANFIAGSTLTLKAIPPADPAPAPAPTEITLLSNVAYKSSSDFIVLPKVGTYSNIKIYDATTNALVATLANTSSFATFLNNKAYTVFARGQMGKTGSIAPGISRATNR